MVFSSILFLLYFLPLFLLAYYALPHRHKNLWLVIASLAFYTWGAPKFLPALLLSCALDYFCSLRFGSRKGKQLFLLTIIANVGMLVYFKYANFFAENADILVQRFGGSKLVWSEVVLPIGISFLTFQKISYLTDVYRGDTAPQRVFSNYVLFITLFPHSIAGPIIRYKEISDQLVNRFSLITADQVYLGLVQFITGLTKKVLISNTVGARADQVFSLSSGELDFTRTWIGILCYTFQIYFDFSGYSDMAIGLGKMMGFRIPVNFNFPYASKSITEFWKRWHITLGSWMKDYLYIPLGGNRVAVNRTYVNLMVVFLLSGFWHGASWNFLVWGGFHGTFLVLERLFLSAWLRKLPAALCVAYTFFVAMIGWVFFRADTLSDALHFISHLFTGASFDLAFLESLDPRFWFVIAVAAFFSFQPETGRARLSLLYEKQPARPFARYSAYAVLVFAWLLNLGELYATGFNPFIYFKF